MPRTEPFEQHPDRYDRWFDRHPEAFAAEVRALRNLTPKKDRGLEIRVGTGRFARASALEHGVDPSSAMGRGPANGASGFGTAPPKTCRTTPISSTWPCS